MSSSIYRKLAITNLKNNRKNYVPYILTCIVTVAMYYIMYAISQNPGLDSALGADSLRQILFLGTIIVGIFAIIFLFYTNSFLIKQRKKEIGLYNVLGLGKRHIAKMLTVEMLVVSVISLGVGLAAGILFSKLMFLILIKILHFDVALRFTIELEAIAGTVILFGCIFIVSLLFNLLQIRLANPIELLNAGNQGEKEPKTKWMMTILGVITLGSGYYIAQTTESPLAALGNFFLAVILVIIGTYALFTAGSIALLKLLKKNKKFYYNTKHFISVSGMIYRMKQNAVGLANICILSTMVLVLVSTSVAMYVGMEDLLKTRYAHECSVEVFDVTEENKEYIRKTIEEISEKHSLTIEYDREYVYTMLPARLIENEFRFPKKDEVSNVADGSYVGIFMMSEAEYNQLENKNVTLAEDEALIFATKTPFKNSEAVMEGKTYQVKQLEEMSVDKESQMMMDYYYVVIHDQGTIDAWEKEYARGVGKTYQKDIDFKESDKEQIPVLEEIKSTLAESGLSLYTECRELERSTFYALYGTFLFLGIFLGFLFLMATVLIIYYKQISEGMDDKERFAIMMKVGLSKREVRQSIRSQVMIVFFLPLFMAILHIMVAFKVITKLLAMLNLVNVPLFLTCTIVTVVVFAIFYVIVFMVTAREYYRIVEK